MAKIEYLHPEDEHRSGYTIAIEARPWAVGGREDQPFYIGSGLNYHANDTLWVELIYSVAGAQIFYTRTFLQVDTISNDTNARMEQQLDEILQQGSGSFVLCGIMPETSLELNVELKSYEDHNNEKHEFSWCNLILAADVGPVFRTSAPGGPFIEIKLTPINVELDEAVRFFRDLIHEIAVVQKGKHPDPASFPEESSDWPFVWQLNRYSYNTLAADYDEDYFSNDLLVEIFSRWMAQLPKGGRVLDAGCGHGQPVITRLLEEGFQVTGSDLSTEMLKRASRKFPQVTFIEKPITRLTDHEVYDGVCSFNSMLYLDPIDLLNSIRRIHLALKPGGLLFLFAYDSGPDWRGEPMRTLGKEWIWANHYGWKEAAKLLEEHGYFRVLENRVVVLDPEDEERIAREREQDQLEEEEYQRKKAENPDQFWFPYMHKFIEHKPYAYALIAKKRKRRARKN